MKYDKPISKFAFKINLRCYNEVVTSWRFTTEVGRCRFPVSKPELKARLVSALETKMLQTAFKFAFKFHSRCYTEGCDGAVHKALYPGGSLQIEVTCCSLSTKPWELISGSGGGDAATATALHGRAVQVNSKTNVFKAPTSMVCAISA